MNAYLKPEIRLTSIQPVITQSQSLLRLDCTEQDIGGCTDIVGYECLESPTLYVFFYLEGATSSTHPTCSVTSKGITLDCDAPIVRPDNACNNGETFSQLCKGADCSTNRSPIVITCEGYKSEDAACANHISGG